MDGRKAEDIDTFKSNILDLFTKQEKIDATSESVKESKVIPKKDLSDEPDEVIAKICKAMAQSIATIISHEIRKVRFFKDELCDQIDEYMKEEVKNIAKAFVAVVTKNYDEIPEEIMEELDKNIDGGFTVERISEDKTTIAAGIGAIVTYFYVKILEFFEDTSVPSFISQAILLSSNMAATIIIGYTLGQLWEIQE